MAFIFSFDPFGNLYLENNGKVYQVNISRNHILYLEEGAFDIVKSYNNKIKQITLLDKQNSLRAKIQKKIDRQDDEEMFDSDDEYYLDDKNEIDYYPEDNDYYHDSDSNEGEDEEYEIIDEDNINKYGEMNLEFNFMKNTEEIEINYRENSDVMALYDTYIYNNDKLIFCSRSKDNSSIYRIRIIGDNIYCRLIGSNEQQYNIKVLENGNLELCPVK